METCPPTPPRYGVWGVTNRLPSGYPSEESNPLDKVLGEVEKEFYCFARQRETHLAFALKNDVSTPEN